MCQESIFNYVPVASECASGVVRRGRGGCVAAGRAGSPSQGSPRAGTSGCGGALGKGGGRHALFARSELRHVVAHHFVSRGVIHCLTLHVSIGHAKRQGTNCPCIGTIRSSVRNRKKCHILLSSKKLDYSKPFR